MFSKIIEFIQETWEKTFIESIKTWQNPQIVDTDVLTYWILIFVLSCCLNNFIIFEYIFFRS